MAGTGRLRQRRILITGAASGIGRRTAQLFAAEGAALILLDRSAEALTEVASETRGFALAVDVTDEASAIEALGLRPKLVEGSPRNFKVTLPHDVALAELYLKGLA
jgi:NADP-dependent 3-hydroxy acid dehydrogenase YdfG